MLRDVKIGDKVTRLISNNVGMILTVSAITDDLIICGDWEFDRLTGAEVDVYLGWGPPPKVTGSKIVTEIHIQP